MSGDDQTQILHALALQMNTSRRDGDLRKRVGARARLTKAYKVIKAINDLDNAESDDDAGMESGDGAVHMEVDTDLAGTGKAAQAVSEPATEGHRSSTVTTNPKGRKRV
ncbi:hypothetical protein FRB90_006477 [Tulasnella sp. 427]|nr:hypothetical protein FRB90_006477 [Tulasnella sp. 427]